MRFPLKPNFINRRPLDWLRWAPFIIMALVSLWVAARGWEPRRAFSVDLSVSWPSLSSSLVKIKHYESTALFFTLGVLAVGIRKLSIPFWLALGMGVAWEIAESTAIQHTSRLSDLAPDLLSGIGCLVVFTLVRRMIHPRSHTESMTEERSL